MTNHIRDVIQIFRRSMLLRDGAGMTDGQLLDRFIERQDQDAFEALMRLHGPMVFGVCRRLLRHHQDAEDAFQATFLVLARKAGGIARRELFANWLYGVARRTALKAKAAALRRQSQEKQVTEMPEPESTRNDVWAGLEPVLDQELGCLPEKYRAAIVLCDLEGKTEKEGARQLGLPQGTLSSRLQRGRAILARRLTRHGFALSTGTLVMLVSQNTASASVPTSLMVSTIKAASALAASQAVPAGLVSTQVAALTRGVLKSMFLTQLKTVAAVLVLIAAVTFGVGGVVSQIPAAAELPNQQEKLSAQAPSPPPKATEKREGVAKADVKESRLIANAAEEKIRASLKAPTSVEFVETSLREALLILKELHNIEMLIDQQAFTEDAITDDSPVSLNVSGLSLESVLELMMSPLQLDYLIQNEVMLITTRTKANSTFETRIYKLENLDGAGTPKDIGRVITETIAPQSWPQNEPEQSADKAENGKKRQAKVTDGANLAVLDGMLVIRQTQRNHREIAQFLKELSAATPTRAP